MQVSPIIEEYLQICWPAMIRRRYHLLLAKGGPKSPHLPEQPLLTHILNGVFGLIRLVRFLVEHQVHLPELNGTFLRKALALYTLHDLGKVQDVERLDETEFSIPLERLQQEYETLGLSQFASLDAHLIRAANVHKRSARQGDLLQTSDPYATLLYTFVRLADAMASAASPEEAASSLSGWLTRLGPEFSPGEKGCFALYWHRIQDVRGVLTNVIHQAVAKQLEVKFHFYPLLYFANGTLYLGPRLDANQLVDRQSFIEVVADDALQSLVTADNSRDMAREGLRRQKYDFEKYVYSFADAPMLLEIVLEEALRVKPDPKNAEKELDDLAAKRGEFGSGWRGTVEARFGLSLSEPKTFHEHWSRAYRYLLYLDTLLRDLNPGEDRVEWFTRHFALPSRVVQALKEEGAIWGRGGMGKYVLVIAYHFLKGQTFADQLAEALPAREVLRRLHEHTVNALRKVDILAGREGVVIELGFRPDLTAYLHEQLLLSWVPEVKIGEDALPAYVRPKRKGHGDRLCSLCNRSSPYVQELRTGILDDEGRIFSNRVLPAKEAPQKNRPWCPVCHLEFVFRKLVGLGLPSGDYYKKSRRLYLYVLPTFSFTPEHISLFSRWLGQFQKVTALPVRDYGTERGIPYRWLRHSELNPDWLEEVQELLESQTQRIARLGGRTYVGERLVAGQIRGQPNYYLITWEKPARGQEQDDARIATRTEAWAKGVLAAIVISVLSGCKVYVTERPYLPITDPADLKRTIFLDGPPPALRLLNPDDVLTLYGQERGERSGLEKALDLTAALWVINEHLQRHLQPKNQKDKRISECLALANTSPLAGVTFYKEYSRLNDGRSPDEILARACQVLLELQGGELMNLVQRLAEKSLEIALPWRVTGRGKPRRYELVFRETVAAMRQAFDAIPELRKTALTNQPPSEQSVSELKNLTAGTLLKALERRQQQRRGEITVRAWGDDLSRLTGEFVDLVADEVYLRRAGGSFARLLRLENTLADGIFYYTDQVLDKKWDEYNQEKAARQAAQS